MLKDYKNLKTYENVKDIKHLKTNDLLKLNNITTPAEERIKNTNAVQKFNDENKVTNDNVTDFSKLKWGKQLELSHIQAKDGSTTYYLAEATSISLENGNTVNIVKNENGNYTYLVLDKDNKIISSAYNISEQEAANKLKDKNHSSVQERAPSPQNSGLRDKVKSQVDKRLEEIKNKKQELFNLKNNRFESNDTAGKDKVSDRKSTKQEISDYIFKQNTNREM